MGDLAKADVFDYIESFYNRIGRHSHLGGVSPEAFERASKRGLGGGTTRGVATKVNSRPSKNPSEQRYSTWVSRDVPSW